MPIIKRILANDMSNINHLLLLILLIFVVKPSRKEKPLRKRLLQNNHDPLNDLASYVVDAQNRLRMRPYGKEL